MKLELLRADAHDAPATSRQENTVARWMMNLPQNIGTSLIDAAVSTAECRSQPIAGWADQHKDHLIADAYNGADKCDIGRDDIR